MDSARFGDQNYSREELVAEMGAAFLCGFTGIENRTVSNSSAYLQSWLEALKSDSRLVLVAAGQAQKAIDHMLGAAGFPQTFPQSRPLTQQCSPMISADLLPPRE